MEAELEGSAGEFYFLQEGVLYCQQGSAKQLVVPMAAQETLGNSIFRAGHLGKHNTTARTRRHFYWPGLQKLPECQQTSAKSPTKFPLQPLSVWLVTT